MNFGKDKIFLVKKHLLDFFLSDLGHFCNFQLFQNCKPARSKIKIMQFQFLKKGSRILLILFQKLPNFNGNISLFSIGESGEGMGPQDSWPLLLFERAGKQWWKPTFDSRILGTIHILRKHILGLFGPPFPPPLRK